MGILEIIELAGQDQSLVPDLMKSEKGNNFRAISESAILDVISPLLMEAGLFYTIDIKDQHLDIREAYGSKGKKLQFIATICLSLYIRNDKEILFKTDSVGMGIDDNDKAMGKAYTYALKYALLKLFRLRYGDDPDAKASEPLYLDKPKASSSSKEEVKTSKESNKKENSSKEKPMSEAQRDYILGMMESKGIPEHIIMDKFGGAEPSRDDFIPMKTARAIIKFLEEQEKLPF